MADLDPLLGLMEGLARLARVQIDLGRVAVALERAAVAQQKRMDALLAQTLPKMAASAERGVVAMLAVQDTLEDGVQALVQTQLRIADHVIEDGLREIERPLRAMPTIDRNVNTLVFTARDILRAIERLGDWLAAFQARLWGHLCAIQRLLGNLYGMLWVLADLIFWATSTLFVPVALGFARLSAILQDILMQLRVWGLEGIFALLTQLSALTNIPILDLLSMFVTKLFEGVLAQIQKMADSINESIKGVAEQIKALAEAQKECCKGKEEDDDDDNDDPWWKKILKDWDKIIEDPWGYLVDWVKDWVWSWFKDGVWGLFTNIASMFLPPFLRAPFRWLMGLLGKFFPQLKEWLASAFWSVVGWVWDGVKWLGSWVWEGLKSLGGWIWDGISAAGAWIWDSLVGLGQAVWDGISSLGSMIWGWIEAAGNWIWETVTDFFNPGGAVKRKIQEIQDDENKKKQQQVNPVTPQQNNALDPNKYDIGYLQDVQTRLQQMSTVPTRLGPGPTQNNQENTFHTQIQLQMPQGTTPEQVEFMRKEAANVFNKQWETQMRRMGVYQNDKLSPGGDPGREPK